MKLNKIRNHCQYIPMVESQKCIYFSLILIKAIVYKVPFLCQNFEKCSGSKGFATVIDHITEITISWKIKQNKLGLNCAKLRSSWLQASGASD